MASFVWVALLTLAASVQPQAAVPAAFVRPTEVRISYTAGTDWRSTAIGLLSFAVKTVNNHPAFELTDPDTFSEVGTVEIHVHLVIEADKTLPSLDTHRLGIAWEVWYRDENMRRIRWWISGLDQVKGTKDNLLHRGGVRVKHGIKAILDAILDLDERFVNELKLEDTKEFKHREF